MKIAKLPNNLVRITPKKEKKLYDEKLRLTFSEAVVNPERAKDFIEV